MGVCVGGNEERGRDIADHYFSYVEESSPLACVHARPKMFGEERLGLWSVREFCGDGILVPQRDSDRPVASPPKPRPSRCQAYTWRHGLSDPEMPATEFGVGVGEAIAWVDGRRGAQITRGWSFFDDSMVSSQK
ncbi:hypothetical protein C4D60_Mb04t37140 [Musa balbisiana]|uniref:Uncharacterized protein n=1 Tax=Musa balbisiana TaxID=52838 RepID=A0A4S8KHE4_MUSBA|nr:hypothetical protein C4D60_Mb04t37140 [Musa balbisiana]